MDEKTMLEGQYRTTLECPGPLAPGKLPDWLASEPETPENPEEIELIEPETPYPGQVDPAELESFPRFPDESDADNEFYWSQLSDHDREYLKWHRSYPASCPWCGGRTRHSTLCDELRASWQVTMPFGKHKGQPLTAVPLDYLQWLRQNSDSLASELREAINARLEGYEDDGRFQHYVIHGELLP